MKKKELEEKRCPICGKFFKPERPWQHFDNPKCRWLSFKDKRQSLKEASK